MKHCPTCTCVNCQTVTQEKQILWQRGIDSIHRYPGQFKPASKHISHVTREPNTAPNGMGYKDSFYVDFVDDDDEPTLDYALENTKAKKATHQPVNNYQATFPTPQQKRAIIDICKRDKSDQEICGLILNDGRVIQCPNISPKSKRDTFLLDYKKYPKAVAIWHRHLAKNGHSSDVTGGDIQLAKESGLSMLMVYDEGIDNMPYEAYIYGEYHPKGHPTNQLLNYQQPNQNKQRSTSPKVQHSGLTDQQKQQIIRHCKRDWSGNAIGGLVLADDTITLEKNQASDPTQFWFNWYGKDAVGVWHRHIKGMPQLLGKDDIRAAKKAGLSMYMIYAPGGNIREDSYIWDEYHPGGKVNRKPVRHYRICFVCPTDEQLKEEIERANRYIKEDNENYQKEVKKTRDNIEQKYNQTQSKLTAATLAIESAKDRVNVLTDKYRLAASNLREVTPIFSRMKQHN